nr:hypothetical protein Iba_chr11fCG7510 [Ipomoea batatas]
MGEAIHRASVVDAAPMVEIPWPVNDIC